VGFWDHWDRRNQRTVEYQNDMARGRSLEEDLSRAFGWRFWVTWLVIDVSAGIIGVLLGRAVEIIALALVATVCFAVVYAQAKRRRREWEAANPE
jgi:hypothetical protein